MRLVIQLLPKFFGLAFAGLISIFAIDLVVAAILSWLDRVDDLVAIMVTVIAVAHALFILAASRLVLGRAVLSRTRWLVGSLLLAFVIGACALGAKLFLPAHAPIGFTTFAAAILAWTPLVPAITTHQMVRVTPLRMARAVLFSLPPLVLMAALGWPAQVCTEECWGLFEGGILMLLFLGAHLFIGSVTAAVVSTLAYVEQPPSIEQKA